MFEEDQHDMTITEIIEFAKTELFEIYKGAVVCGGDGGRPYEVQHDYGNANVSYWETNEEARTEVARLWQAGHASWIEDFIVKRADEVIADHANEREERISVIKAEMREKRAA
ncbi:hypothetical protein KYK30_14260 [Shinella yambaruensis]|uniref:Uncharacterized protein n=1 Tax=Shinella yambaruensis TaxID=415996 RepID=A0ABQ5ZAP6_9HYPH|nr:hypothetical protein [Shinella yambaruensis]MCJ8024419.1 hypothetical protein [Shinella yambaruensis]MCU7980861.1 hypothetical protein [Shinella yambaruensis]GLR49718.1 hypothetical protein GCM10007923_09230 [Shinella yambaruensis]